MEQPTKEDDNVSLKDILNTLNVFLKELIRFWWIVLIGGLLGAALFAYKAYSTKPQYTAKLTFMLNEDTGPAMNSAISSLLGRVGVSGGKYNLEKITELAKTRNIIEQVIFSKTIINKREDYIGNFIIKEYNLKVDPQNREKEILFESDDQASFTLDENAMLLKVYNLLVGPQGIIVPSISEKSGIMSLNMVSTNEPMAIVVVDTLYDKLSKFYINKSVEKDLTTYNLLKNRVEAIYGQMNRQTDQSAAIQDKSLGVWEEKSKLPIIKYDRDARISALMYAEALKNLEIADFSLKTNTPFIQLIDKPLLPLDKKEDSPFKFAIIGLIVGGLVFCLIIIIRRIIIKTITPIN